MILKIQDNYLNKNFDNWCYDGDYKYLKQLQRIYVLNKSLYAKINWFI